MGLWPATNLGADAATFDWLSNARDAAITELQSLIALAERDGARAKHAESDTDLAEADDAALRGRRGFPKWRHRDAAAPEWVVTFITPDGFDVERDGRSARVDGEFRRTSDHEARFTVVLGSARWRQGERAMNAADRESMLREIAREADRRGWVLAIQ